MEEGRGLFNGSPSEQAIGSKSLGEKRNGNGSGEGDEFGSKRAKVRDLVPGLAVPDEAATSDLKSQSVGNIEIARQSNLSGEEKSGVTEIHVVPDAEASDRVEKEDEDNTNYVSRRELNIDIKVGDISGLDKHNLSRFLKNSSHLKSREISVVSEASDRAVEESGPLQGWMEMKQNSLLQYHISEKAGSLRLGNLDSTLGESDSMRRWKEMKRNGFLSGPLGGAAVSSSVVSSSPGDRPVQKQQKSKRKGECLKKRKELPEREQADRFSNTAAPIGLLKELNPGIINRVRNKKQVCSIIKTLVRIGTEDVVGEECHVDSNSRGISHFSCDNASLADPDPRREHLQSACDRPATVLEGMIDPRMPESVGEDGKVPFKLPSTENADSVANLHSSNCTNPTPLILEAATVASQWLELLHQDITGRLSALEHSRNRVQSILTTELPLLASREFPTNQENTPQGNDKTMMEHQKRWIALFDQMDNALSDEKRNLDCWLNKVKEMQSHCNEGLRYMDMVSTVSSQSSGVSDTDSSMETSMAVQAAAASIYSTCSFLLSMMNSSCS